VVELGFLAHRADAQRSTTFADCVVHVYNFLIFYNNVMGPLMGATE